MWPRTKGCEWPLEAGNGKEMESPIELPEATGPANTLILTQWDICWPPELWTINLCCFIY